MPAVHGHLPSEFCEANAMSTMRKVQWTGLFLALTLVPGGGNGLPAADDGPANAPATQPVAQPQRRLPANYAKLDLTDEQRERIYALQAPYQEKIQRLSEEISQLRAARDQELRKVLTPTQEGTLSALRTEAKEKRSSKATAASKRATSVPESGK